MADSREGHRQEALNELQGAQSEGDVAKTNRLLEALVHAVLALSAPTEEELKRRGMA